MASITKAELNAIEHDFRITSTPNEIFKDEKNDYFIPFALNKKATYEEVINFRDDYIKQQTELYTHTTGKKLAHNTNTLYTAVIDCNADTTAAEIYETLGRKLEEDLGTQIFAVVVHKDEGKLIDKKSGTALTSGHDFIRDDDGNFWFIKDGGKKGAFGKKHANNTYKLTPQEMLSRYELTKNYHAHIEFSGLRSNGKSIKSYDKKKTKEQRKGDFKAYGIEYAKDFCAYANKIFDISHAHSVNNILEMVSKELDGGKNEQLNELFKESIEAEKMHRIRGFKHLMGNLNAILRREALSQKDLNATKTMLQQAGVFDRPNILRLERQNEQLMQTNHKLQAIKLQAAKLTIQNQRLNAELKAHEDATNIAEPGQALLTKTEIIGAIKANFSRCSNDSETKALTDYYRHIKNTPAEDARMREDEFIEQINRIISSEQRLQEQNQELQAERDTAQKRVDELEADRDRAQKIAIKLRAERDTAQKRVDELQADRDRAQKIAIKLRTERDTAQKRVDELEAERKRAEERECELETANQRLNAKLSDLSNKSQKTTQDMANELKTLQNASNELKTAQMKIDKLQAERDTAQKRVDELEADRDQAQKRVDELEAELDETRSLYNATASVNEWLQGQKQKLQAELDELQEVQDYELDELQEAQYYELDELQEAQYYELDEPQEVQDYELDEPQQKPTIRHRR